MDSITKYIESKLLLKVNRKKSKIGRPIEIKYLGFTFYNQFKAKKYKAKAHEKSVQKVVRKWNDQGKREVPEDDALDFSPKKFYYQTTIR